MPIEFKLCLFTYNASAMVRIWISIIRDPAD